MKKLYVGVFSAATALMLLAGATGAAWMTPIASAASPQVTTLPATGITQSDATLNGMNGDTDATGHSFWVSTSTFTPAASSSPTMPAGVYTTADLGAIASSTAFSAPLSSVTGLPAVTASTTYYYTAWSDVGGIWYPGAVLSFATLPSAPAVLAPAISNVGVSGIGTSTATVTWDTDLPADSQVVYGTTTSYGSSSTLDTTATTTHSVTLTGLSEGTLYHFAAESANTTGTTTSPDQAFVTQSTASSTPLAVTGVTAVSSTATADNSYADGWKWVMHLTVPDNENAFRIKFSDWAMSSTTSFPAGGNMRVFSPQSSNASSEASAISETNNNYSDWLYLTGDTASTTPGRQIDLTIEVKIPVGTPAGSYTTTYTGQSWPGAATSTAI